MGVYIICPFLSNRLRYHPKFPQNTWMQFIVSQTLTGWYRPFVHVLIYIFARVMQMQQYMHTGKDKRMFGRIWMWMDPFKCIDGKLRCVYVYVCLSSLRILKCMYKWTHALQHTSRWHSPILVHIGGWSNTDPRAHTHKLTHEPRKLQTQKMITKVT